MREGEEARRIVAEKLASSSSSSLSLDRSADTEEEKSSSEEMIKRARSILEGY